MFTCIVFMETLHGKIRKSLLKRENNVQTLILRMDLKNGITCPMLNLTGFGEIGLFSPSVLGTLFLITTMRSERTNLACTGI